MNFGIEAARPLRLDVSIAYYKTILRNLKHFKSPYWESLNGEVEMDNEWRRVSFWVHEGRVLGADLLDIKDGDTFCDIPLGRGISTLRLGLKAGKFSYTEYHDGIEVSGGRVAFSFQGGKIATIGWGDSSSNS